MTAVFHGQGKDYEELIMQVSIDIQIRRHINMEALYSYKFQREPSLELFTMTKISVRKKESHRFRKAKVGSYPRRVNWEEHEKFRINSAPILQQSVTSM